MSVKYKGLEPIIMQNGKVIKHNEIVEGMTDAEGRRRKGFEVITEKKTEIKDKNTGKNYE